MAKKYWLMKTEPNVFSFDDLTQAPKKTTCWEGVRNYQARNFMRDEMKNGDEVFIYHSNTDVPAVVGIAEVVKEAYPDSHAMKKGHKYYDSKTEKKGINPWVMVDVKAKEKMSVPVSRPMMMEIASLKEMRLLARGNRLSVMPISAAEFKTISKMGKPKKV